MTETFWRRQLNRPLPQAVLTIAADVPPQNSPAPPHTPKTLGSECHAVPVTPARALCRRSVPERSKAPQSGVGRKASAQTATSTRDRQFSPAPWQTNRVRRSFSKSRQTIGASSEAQDLQAGLWRQSRDRLWPAPPSLR